MKGFRRTLYIMCAAFAIVTSLLSCNEGIVYDKYLPTPLTGWGKNEALTFDVPPMQEAGTYSIGVGLRTDEAFPFMSLTLVVDQTIEPEHQAFTDTLSCLLADDKGNILGKGISCFQYDFILKDIYLNENDTVHVSIRHAMKREIMPGVSDIGLKLSRKK